MISFLSSAVPVIVPVLATIAVELVFLKAVRRRAGRTEFFEIGVFFSLVVMVYSLLPSLSYVVNGLSYSPFGDGRLFAAQPTPNEVAPIYWLYFLFLAAFTATYWARRGHNRLAQYSPPTVDNRIFWILVIAYLTLRLFFVFVRVHYSIAEPETYGETYLLFKDLPLVVQQLANHLSGMVLTLQLAIMVFMVLNYRQYKLLIFFWIGAEFLSLAFLQIGARSGLFVLLLVFLASYHVAVRRLTKRLVAIVGISALLLFLALGVVRSVQNSSLDEGINLLASSNEFDAVFANAYDIRELKAQGRTSEIFPRFYVGDFLNLIPQQISPFQKLDVAAWYVESFYPSLAAKGGGLAFGVIPESIVGFGWFDVLCRGVVIGWSFAAIYRYLFARTGSFWMYCFYLWITVLSYQVFRAGTFVLVPRAIYQFLTVVIIVRMTSSVFTQRRESNARLSSGGLPIGTAN
jgi:oligosaccharide repeat unit polymerase